MDNLKAVEKALKKSSVNGMLQCNDRQCNTCARAALKEIKTPQKADASGSNSTTLLGARATAITALGELAEEFRKLGVYHYEEMVRGQQASINGAVLTVEYALERST